MAATLEGARLTEAHRVAQADIVAEALKDVLAVWPALDPTALDATFPAYARIVEAALANRRAHSASVAAAYLRAFREAEGVSSPLQVVMADALEAAQAQTSLLVTGPIAVKVARRSGKTVEAAAQTGLVQTLGAASRLVQQGGRETVQRTVLADDKALGVHRVTDGNPCAFCAMLSGRGAVYRSQLTADFHAHDRCGCHAEPIYRPNSALPGAHAQRFADLWKSSTDGLSGDAALSAFRAAYNAQRTA